MFTAKDIKIQEIDCYNNCPSDKKFNLRLKE